MDNNQFEYLFAFRLIMMMIFVLPQAMAIVGLIGMFANYQAAMNAEIQSIVGK